MKESNPWEDSIWPRQEWNSKRQKLLMNLNKSVLLKFRISTQARPFPLSSGPWESAGGFRKELKEYSDVIDHKPWKLPQQVVFMPILVMFLRSCCYTFFSWSLTPHYLEFCHITQNQSHAAAKIRSTSSKIIENFFTIGKDVILLFTYSPESFQDKGSSLRF